MIRKITLILLIWGVQISRLPINYMGLFFEVFLKAQELTEVEIMVCIQRLECVSIPVKINFHVHYAAVARMSSSASPLWSVLS